MEMLTKEEVMHVAHLARIEVTEEEISDYQVQLKQLINEIDKIKNVEVKNDNILVTPVEHITTMREDEKGHTTSFDEIKKNVPNTVGNFVEVVVMINE